jgi:hypothetical protein
MRSDRDRVGSAVGWLTRACCSLAGAPARAPRNRSGTLDAPQGRNPAVQGLQPRPAARAQAVPDATGREDLVAALTRRLLLAAAAGLGCNRLALCDSATRLAARAVAAAAKGAGRALPASLQHFDARRAPAAARGVRGGRRDALRRAALPRRCSRGGAALPRGCAVATLLSVRAEL